MSLPWINGLRAEIWTNKFSSIEERLLTLNEMEKSLASQENRTYCEIVTIPEKDRIIGENGTPILRGQYDHINEQIQIDPILLANNRPPYQAVETYFFKTSTCLEASKNVVLNTLKPLLLILKAFFFLLHE